MDFFDKLSKKASETYQATKEKATNISEELKMKGKINELKQKVEELYLEIGKTVYSELKEGKTVTEEEILAKCEEISQASDEIAKINDSLLTMKKMKTCVECGAKINIEDIYCSKCGKEQPKVETVKVENTETNAKEAEVIEVSDVQDNNE